MKIPYGKQKITDEDIAAVVEVLKSDFLTQGPAIPAFENKITEVVKNSYAVAVNNATAGLHLAYKTLNRNPLKKVIVTSNTFAASSNCILFEKGAVDFSDIDPKTYNIDLQSLEEKIRLNPSEYQGIIAVDFAGLPVNTEQLRVIADRYNLWIISDSCHAIGGSFKNEAGEVILCGSGRYVDLSVFSFHPVKHIATGEGGAITTKDRNFYENLIRLRSHGMERDSGRFESPSDGGWYHEMQQLGFNYRMPDINAALGLSQLNRIESNINKRNEIAKIYKNNLSGLPISYQKYDEGKFINAYHLFVIETDRRKELYEFLKTKEIYTQVHYLPVYMHPYYKKLGFKAGYCPHAENYYKKCLSLPMYHSMKNTEQMYVIEKIHDFFRE